MSITSEMISRQRHYHGGHMDAWSRLLLAATVLLMGAGGWLLWGPGSDAGETPAPVPSVTKSATGGTVDV